MMQRYKWLYTFVLLLPCQLTFAQLKLGGTSAAHAKSALLELESANQGLLLTRISDTTSINTITPPDGMLIYYTPSKQLMVRANSAWQGIIDNSYSTASLWSTTGNSSTGMGHFIGTSDNKSLRFRTNNTERMILDSLGNVGVGVTAPTGAKLSVSSTAGYGVSASTSATGSSAIYGASTATGSNGVYGASASGSALYGAATTSSANPLTLTGLKTGGLTDSLLTVNSSGVVRKIGYPNVTTVPPVTLTAGTTTTWDCSASPYATLTLTANTTLSISNVTAGMKGTLIVKINTLGTVLTWPSGSLQCVPDLSGIVGTTVSDVTKIGITIAGITLSNTLGTWLCDFYYDGTNYYWNLCRAKSMN